MAATLADVRVLVCDSCTSTRFYYMKDGHPIPIGGSNRKEREAAVASPSCTQATEVHGPNIVIDSAGWTADEHVGKIVEVLDGDDGNLLQRVVVRANTEDTLLCKPVLKGDSGRARTDPQFATMPWIRMLTGATPAEADEATVKLTFWDNDTFICPCGTQHTSIS